jgi:nucleoside-diphosphate-sugar epimerase
MKIGLTGASGFVGKNLVNYLSSYTLHEINRNELSEDLGQLFKNCDTFIHLAGKAHDLKKTSNPDSYYEVNFELTKRLFDAFLTSGSSQFIYVSSVKAAADSVTGILTEDVVPNPQTHYGKSKLLAEQYLLSKLLPKDKSIYILRPCMIHGPHNKGNLNLLYQFVKNKIPYPLVKFKNKRSFLSIENMCFIIEQLILQKTVPSGIYNVADDDSISTTEVISILASAAGIKPRFWSITPEIINSFAKIGDLLRLPFNTERLNKLTENFEVSNIKLIKALNKSMPLSTAEGLKITANSFTQKSD